MRSLVTLLKNAGVDLTGWKLITADSISSDGSVIAGVALHATGVEETFIATIPVDFVPEPSSLHLLLTSAWFVQCAAGGLRPGSGDGSVAALSKQERPYVAA